MKNDISCAKMFRYGFWAGAGYIVAKVTLTAIAAKIALAGAKKAVGKAGSELGDKFSETLKESIQKAANELDDTTKAQVIDYIKSAKKPEEPEEEK